LANLIQLIYRYCTIEKTDIERSSAAGPVLFVAMWVKGPAGDRGFPVASGNRRIQFLFCFSLSLQSFFCKNLVFSKTGCIFAMKFRANCIKGKHQVQILNRSRQ
jgi:hypothetical protein